MTPLMWAAWKGKVGVVEWLIASSAKLDRQEKWGRTALILAADEGHLDVVRFWNGCFPVNFALLSLFFAVRFGCFSKPVPKLTFLRCERLSLYLHPSLRVSLAWCRVPGDESVRSVAASTAAKNKFAWYGKSALEIAQGKGHHEISQLFVLNSGAAAIGQSL